MRRSFILWLVIGFLTPLSAGCGAPADSSEDEASPAEDTDDGAPAEAPSEPTPLDPDTPGALGDCQFDVDYEVSSGIGTVGIVRWAADIEVDSASIFFGLKETGHTMFAPVDLSAPDYRTLLLGMKGKRKYVFQIMVTGEGKHCRSQGYTLTTDPVPNAVPRIAHERNDDDATATGFIVTSAGMGNFFGTGANAPPAGTPMFIFDMDGDIVWWANSPHNTTRARMDWEGKNMWMSALNYPPGRGEMRRVSMDGLEVEPDVAGLSDTHHDFAVLPGGVVTSIVYKNGCDAIVERDPDGTLTTVVENVSSLYRLGGGLTGKKECHVNAITYQPDAETYVLSDRNASVFVRVTRAGELLWQFGGSNPMGPHFVGNWQVNHGHHFQSDGALLFFNNESGNPSPVKEYALDERNDEATLLWDYAGAEGSITLGDVQRLGNGNTLITYSNVGTIVEVDPSKKELQRFTTESLGYSMYRESLYGPPSR